MTPACYQKDIFGTLFVRAAGGRAPSRTQLQPGGVRLEHYLLITTGAPEVLTSEIPRGLWSGQPAGVAREFHPARLFDRLPVTSAGAIKPHPVPTLFGSTDLRCKRAMSGATIAALSNQFPKESVTST